MAGHSKWANIKRRKGAQDAKRGKIFTRLLREITIAVKQGGGDPSGNPRLRAGIQECKANNVPNEKIERAIKKGTGDLEGVSYEEVTYEGYGPGGVAMIVETMTDNRNRTVGEVRHVFNKYGGSLGENGCVSYLFDKRGYIVVADESMDEDAFMELALELEVDDVETEKGFEIYTAMTEYNRVLQSLNEREVPVDSAQLAMIPSTTVELGADNLPQFLRLMEAIEELDDVQNVWANFEADDELLEAHSG